MVEFAFRAYMNNRDVTDWITDVEIEHHRKTLYRQWTFTFAGWSSIEEDAKWDLFGSYDPTAEPRAEILARAGVLPPDRERLRLVVAAGRMPVSRIRGYDFVWTAQRKRPRETIVVVPSSAYIVENVDGRPVLRENSVAGALERHEGPIGKYRVWTHVRTIRDAVNRLGNAAGVRVDYRLPNENMIPYVIPPTASYWEAMLELVQAWKPEIYYRDSTNTLVFADPLHSHYSVGGALGIPAGAVVRMTGAPILRKRTRRILIRIPQCR
jgi:hypothetical protein